MSPEQFPQLLVLPLVLVRMLTVLLEVLLVGRHQLGLALDDQQVFRVVFFGGVPIF